MAATSRANSRLASLLVVAAIAWHVLAVLAPPRQPPPRGTAGRDYASYHYAAVAAWQGEDPYEKATLDRLARAEGTRQSVHPYLYPPPFLLLLAWAPVVDLGTGFVLWGLLNELCLLAAALALIRAWSEFEPQIAPLVAVAVALTWGVAYGVQLGQANMTVLALIATAWWQLGDRPQLAGALIGIACMLKMSPALIVAWWVLERRWIAVASALASAGVAALLSFGMVGLDGQLSFYGRVLPGLGAGDYNGLTIKIGMFGNHSWPNLMHQLLPSGSEQRLSLGARLLGIAGTLTWIGVVGWRWRGTRPGPAQASYRLGAVLLTMLMVPVYTYEHHLVFAIPAMVLAVRALSVGDLGARWAAPIGLALAVIAYPLPYLKGLATWISPDGSSLLYFVVQELPFVSLCVLLAALVRVSGAETGGQARPSS